jgi:heptosyltransferase-3
LVNDDTLGIAKTIAGIDTIHTFSYSWRALSFAERVKKEFALFKALYKKYDLSINLTANDRSILYAVAASPHAISAVEEENKKAWWKKIFLKQRYTFDLNKHILSNNITPLKLLDIEPEEIILQVHHTQSSQEKMEQKLQKRGIEEFIIFHPSAQHEYKIYPKEHRDTLLELLNSLKIPIIVTGAASELELSIKAALPKLEYMYDFMGETTLDEYIALSDLSMAYIGMDTLNMHIAAGQNKSIFAIFGPTLPQVWSPWSNRTQSYAKESKTVQTYGNVTLFQANMPCVACGLAGCDDRGGKSDCLYMIDPNTIFKEVSKCLARSL